MNRYRRARAIGFVAALSLAAVSLVEGQSATTGPSAPVIRTDTIVRIARDRAASVLFLHVLSQELGPEHSPLVSPTEEGLGSGVVIDANGLGSCL